ncbi:hypothetical protein DFS34DRAFT_620104 [Phlyctochytrium arcticum]|nr:hypothetical protein DFS34DRAFT_620104 [Phlyctochytrium arcticum]
MTSYGVSAALVLIPLALYLSQSYLSSSLKTSPKPSSTDTQLHHIHFATTSHTRHYPIKHSFRYPLVYFRLTLGHPLGLPSWLAGWERGLFSIRESDYLRDIKGTLVGNGGGIKDRALAVLEEQGVPRSAIGDVELVTMPRCAGYAFNPLSIFFAYAPDAPHTLVATILEVNNTFGERHIYVCKASNKVPSIPGYEHTHKINRSFHVSPFNNRSGSYEASFKNPKRTLDVLLNIRDYTDATTPSSSPAAPIHLTARVQGPPSPLTTRTTLSILAIYPITTFLTVPRILKEAFVLAYQKKMPIYQRPSPMRVPKDGAGMVWKPLTGFQSLCRSIVLAYLSDLGLNFEIVEPSRPSTHLSPSTPGVPPPITLHVVSPLFYMTMVLCGNHTARALGLSFVRGDVRCTESDLGTLLGAMARHVPSSSIQDTTTEWHQWWINRVWTIHQFPSPFNQQPSFGSVPILPTTPETNRVGFAVWKGSVATRLEQRLFRLLANFVVDPYATEERMQGYISSATKSGGAPTETGLVGEPDDGSDIIAMERERFDLFRRVLDRVVHS